jgi:IgGFc binding protein/PKD domain
MKLYIILFFLLVHQFSFSQCLDNYGKEFYISFLATGKLSITSKVNTSGIVTNPNTGYSQSFTVTANNFTIVNIPFSESVSIAYNTINNKCIIVKSNDPIAIHSINGGVANSDIALIFPLKSLGTEYFAMAWGRTFVTNNFNFAPAAVIMATQNNTIIEVIPTSELSNGQPINIPFQITLNKGENYIVASKEDFTGTSITVVNGYKPIAVFCGQRGSQIPLNYNYADHLFEQIPAVSKLGKEFVTPILKGRGKNFIKIAATQNNTIIKIDAIYTTTINKGQQYKFETTNIAKYIETNKPVLVGVFGTSYQYDSLLGNNMGDPTFIILSPMQQLLKNVFFETPKLDSIKMHKMCFIVKTSYRNNTFLDGINIGNATVPVNGNPFYSMATMDLTIGQHNIINDSGVIVYVNGYGFHQAYGYTASQGLNDLYNKTSFECNGFTSEDTITAKVCKGINIFKINTLQNNSAYTWDFGDGTTLVHTDGNSLQQNHTFKNLGNYTVTLFIENCNDKKEIKKLKVFVTNPPSLLTLQIL